MSTAQERRQRAVALRYGATDSAPRVVAKGYGITAQNIIDVAHQHNLAVCEHPEIIDILMQLDLDERIPEQLYEAVAQILSWLYEVDGNKKAHKPSAASPFSSPTPDGEGFID